jgi:hypothetical protein
MKALILAALLATAATAQAEETKPSDCAVLEVYARLVMDVRQGGASLKEVMNTIEDNDKFGRSIIIAAYSKPQYMTDTMKDKTINDFANSAYLECLTIK